MRKQNQNKVWKTKKNVHTKDVTFGRDFGCPTKNSAISANKVNSNVIKTRAPEIKKELFKLDKISVDFDIVHFKPLDQTPFKFIDKVADLKLLIQHLDSQ